jgi:hypothetical protein
MTRRLCLSNNDLSMRIMGLPAAGHCAATREESQDALLISGFSRKTMFNKEV